MCYTIFMKNAEKSAQGKAVIPFRQSLFWDVDPKTIDPEKHAVYIIERMLDFGRDDEVRWMWKYYPRKLLKTFLSY